MNEENWRVRLRSLQKDAWPCSGPAASEPHAMCGRPALPCVFPFEVASQLKPHQRPVGTRCTGTAGSGRCVWYLVSVSRIKGRP